MTQAIATLRPHQVIYAETCTFVDAGDGTQMVIPTARLERTLGFGDAATVRIAASRVIETFAFLIEHCDKEEAWRRLTLMKQAMVAAPDLNNS